MSGLDLSLIKWNTQSDTKETASSIKKLNTWSTPYVFNNDCIKKIMEFCNVRQIFRLAGVNHHCNHIVSTSYSNLTFYLRTLHSNFTNSGSFVTPAKSDHEEEIAWMGNLKREIILRNGSLKLLKYDVMPIIGEDQNFFIKKGNRTFKVENKNDGKCFYLPLSEKIISIFRIAKNNYILVTSDGRILKNSVKIFITSSLNLVKQTCLYIFPKTSVSKAFLIADKIYLLCKTNTEHNFILRYYDINKKERSILCEKSSWGHPVINCIANNTHLFVIFEFGSVACYDKHNNILWEKLHYSTNKNSFLELNDKFLLITASETFDGSLQKYIHKVFNIADGENSHLKVTMTKGVMDETFNLWGDYIISQQSNNATTAIELWNPNNGKPIISISRKFPFDSHFLLPLKDNEGLMGVSISDRKKHPKKVRKYEFFLLKPS